MRVAALLIALYLCGAWFTTGHHYSRHLAQCRMEEPVSLSAERCYKYAEIDSIAAGAIWPIYWFYRSAFEAAV